MWVDYTILVLGLSIIVVQSLARGRTERVLENNYMTYERLVEDVLESTLTCTISTPCSCCVRSAVPNLARSTGPASSAHAGSGSRPPSRFIGTELTRPGHSPVGKAIPARPHTLDDCGYVIF